MYIFVYGTLKRGYGNNRLLQKDTVTFIDEVITKDLFFMNSVGFPYLFPKNIFNFNMGLVFRRARGELYFTEDERVIANLDALEGEGHHYHRKTIAIDGHEDKEVFAYFQLDKNRIKYGIPCRIDETNCYVWSR
jgi:gamma-glutamylaminecyclotransferase